MMKIRILILLFAVVFMSCKKDKKNPTPSSNYNVKFKVSLNTKYEETSSVSRVQGIDDPKVDSLHIYWGRNFEDDYQEMHITFAPEFTIQFEEDDTKEWAIVVSSKRANIAPENYVAWGLENLSADMYYHKFRLSLVGAVKDGDGNVPITLERANSVYRVMTKPTTYLGSHVGKIEIIAEAQETELFLGDGDHFILPDGFDQVIMTHDIKDRILNSFTLRIPAAQESSLYYKIYNIEGAEIFNSKDQIPLSLSDNKEIRLFIDASKF